MDVFGNYTFIVSLYLPHVIELFSLHIVLRPARTLALRFSECREDQIVQTTKQRALRRFVHLIHSFLAEFAGSAVLT